MERYGVPFDSISVLKRLQRFERAAGNGEIGARARKSPAEGLAESAARAGDDGNFAGEVERWLLHWQCARVE
jgi:hypothetical protein